MSELINEILANRKATSEEAIKAFDSLEPVSSEFMHGRWKGFEIKTGHPFDELFAPSGWYGKIFLNNEDVHPLVFFGTDKKELYAANPKLIPFNMNLPKDERLGMMMNMARIVLETKESKARLRNLEYRGRVSATMIYDDIPILDTFVKIDDNSVLGVMDFKGNELPFFFVLERDDHSEYEIAPLKALDEKFKELFDMEVQNRAFALKVNKDLLEKTSVEEEKAFYTAWVAFEEFLQEQYAPYAAKYELSQEPRTMANIQVGLGKLAAGLLPTQMAIKVILDDTIKYLEKLKELERVSPEEDRTFFAFVVKHEAMQIETLKLRLDGKSEEAVDLLYAFVEAHKN